MATVSASYAHRPTFGLVSDAGVSLGSDIPYSYSNGSSPNGVAGSINFGNNISSYTGNGNPYQQSTGLYGFGEKFGNLMGGRGFYTDYDLWNNQQQNLANFGKAFKAGQASGKIPEGMTFGDWLNYNGVGRNGTTGRGFGFSDIANLAQAGGALWNAYNGMRALEMAQEQFEYQKGLANRNLANQAKMINTHYDNAARISAAFSGGPNQAELERQYLDAAKAKHVSGTI